MCYCGLEKKTVKLTFLIFWTYLQLGSCGLKLFRHLDYRQFFNGNNVNSVTNSNQSPCPNIFEYRYDEGGRLYGFIEIPVTNTNTMDLEVVFCVGNRVNKGAEGSISLPYLNNQQIIDNIAQRKILNYNVNFPAWRGYQPKITKIIVNGDLICTGQPYYTNQVPILTTINLRHRLQVNVTPLISPIRRQEYGQNNFYQTNNNNNNYNNDNNNAEEETNPIFDVRNDNGPRNPYGFKPKFTTPAIVFQPDPSLDENNPYSRNPFLNRLSTTPRPDFDEGVSYYNNFSPTSPGSFSSTSKPKKPTSAPNWTSNPIVESPVTRDGTSQNQNDVCGRPVVTNALILNGRSVPRGAFPWLVALFVKTNSGLEYHCTGTLVSKRHVITAAHCLKPDSYIIDPERIILVMGRLNIQGWGATDEERIIGAEQLFVHPNFKSSTADADISVIIMKGNVIFSKSIRPICLWLDQPDLNLVVGKRGVVVGWGKDENGLRVSPEPKQVELPIVSQEQCLRSNYTFADITSERTFCAGDRNGTGPCNGDSGSGFIMLKNGRWHLRGIVSMSLSQPYTRTCDLSNYVVFTDATKFIDWLLSFK